MTHMDGNLQLLWVYLSASPLLWLTLTLIAYQAGDWVWRRSGGKPWLNPVLLAVILLVGLLTFGKVDYQTYFAGAQFVHFLLGPATVALAVPLYRQVQTLKHSAPALLAALIVGSLAAIASAVGIGWLLGASERTLLSMAPKSVTTPIAMAVSEQIGGLPSLTAVFVILTGITGAVLGTLVLDLLRVRDWRARGFATGLAAHGIGTAAKLRINPVAGAFAGIAIGLNGLATAILLPVLVRLLK